MDSGRIRRELGRSVRLPLSEERWLPAGLLAAAVGYPIWLAGTGTAVSRLAETAVGPVSFDPWSSEATALAAAFALLWILLPAVAAVWFVTDRLTNLRGNVERHYRLDHPSLLLVPPSVLFLAIAAAGAVQGFSWPVVTALGVAAGFFLVRTAAYGYRVYSFSHPRLLQLLVFVAAAVASVAVLTRTVPLTGQDALVEGLAAHYGVTDRVFGTVSRAGVSGPALPLAAAATPVALGGGYLLLQFFASLAVRGRKPDVPRSAIRAGQRYPEVVRPDSPQSPTSPAAGGSGDADAEADDGRDESPDESAEQSPKRATATRGEGDQPAAEGDAGESDEADDADDEDTVGHTRVFTPPDDGEFDAPGAPAAGGSDVAGTDADDDAAAASVDGSTQVMDATDSCDICGETFEPDPERTHCPNCNANLDV